MRRSLTLTLRHFEQKWVPSQSIRKQMCHAYLQWKERLCKESKQQFIELAKEFRRVEARIGQKRTKLEKIARKHFQAVSKRKKLQPSREGAKKCGEMHRDKRMGIHTPEQRAKLSEMWREIVRKQVAENRSPQTKEWVITSPDGIEFRIRNAARWFRERGYGNDYDKVRKGVGRRYFGYGVRYYDPDIDSHIPWETELFPNGYGFPNLPDGDDGATL